MRQTPHSPVRAVIYLRISQDREMDGLAIDRQRADCERIAKDRGWEVLHEYVDQSKSATDKTKVRPAYDEMVRDYEAGSFDAIVCYDLDRLTRQPRQLEDWIDAAEDRGLKLITANGEADLNTDGGRLYARVKAAVARGEVERKSARQSAAHVQRASQGRPPKGVRPFGYAIDGSVVPAEAEVVAQLFKLFAVQDGPSLAALAAGLSGKEARHIPQSLHHVQRFTRTLAIERNERRAEDGLDPRPVPEDGPWSSSTVLGILRNPRYAGWSVYTDRRDRTKNKRRSWYAQVMRDENGDRIKGQWEPIVEEATWLAVQERLDMPERVTNRTGSTSRKHLGSGLFLCGICGKPVKAHGARYRCAGHMMRVRSSVDDWVLRIVRARLARPDLKDALPSRDEPRLRAIQAQIAAHEGKIKRAQHDYDEEIIESYDLKRVRERENAKIVVLEAERTALTATTDLGGVLNAESPVAAFDDADLAIQRRVVDFFCTVELLPAPRGRRTFDPETVRVTPKGNDARASS